MKVQVITVSRDAVMRNLLRTQSAVSPLDDPHLADLINQAIARRSAVAAAPGLPPVPTVSDERIARALSYIEVNLGHPRRLGLASIAKVAGAGRFTLSRGFNAEVGVGLRRYVTQRRVVLARSMLTNPRHAGRNLIDVAYEVGFSSPSRLSESFRAHYSATPGRYRREAAPPHKRKTRPKPGSHVTW